MMKRPPEGTGAYIFTQYTIYLLSLGKQLKSLQYDAIIFTGDQTLQ